MVWQSLSQGMTIVNLCGRSKISSSLGLEGLITFKRENRYEPETYQVLVPVNPSEPDGECVKIGVFDKVTVEISIEKVCLFCNAFVQG